VYFGEDKNVAPAANQTLNHAACYLVTTSPEENVIVFVVSGFPRQMKIHERSVLLLYTLTCVTQEQGF
jgi:hypothetical protein